MRKSCRDCNLLLDVPYMDCLMYAGFIGIEKMKENMAYENCESFIPRNPQKDLDKKDN